MTRWLRWSERTRFVRLELLPVLQGTNQVLEWRALDDSDRPAEKGLPIEIVN